MVSLRGPPGTLDPPWGSPYLASDLVLSSYTAHIPVNGDLPVPRGTNSKHISLSALRRAKTMSYNVAPGKSGTGVISFAHYLSAHSLTPVYSRQRGLLCLGAVLFVTSHCYELGLGMRLKDSAPGADSCEMEGLLGVPQISFDQRANSS